MSKEAIEEAVKAGLEEYFEKHAVQSVVVVDAEDLASARALVMEKIEQRSMWP